MKFPYIYHEVEPSAITPDGKVYRPELPLRVIGNEADVEMLALVDTGADETILPMSFAELLGVPLTYSRPGQAEGITGQPLEVVPGDIELVIEQGDEHYRWKATVGFIEFGEEAYAAAILGHRGFLRHFTATFDGEEREVELVRNAIDF